MYRNNLTISLKNLFCIMLLCFVSSIMQNTTCDAKVVTCNSHEYPTNITGEFIAVYDYDADTTTYYDSEELTYQNLLLRRTYEPYIPPTVLFQTSSNPDFDTTNKVFSNYNINSSSSTSISDNRIKVTSSELSTSPYISICKLTTTFENHPGYITCGSGFELWTKLCATAGHNLLNSQGYYFQTLKAEFAYSNGTVAYTMTEDDLSGYVLHGEFKGSNWQPAIDYAFLLWDRDISNYVGHFGISWSYSVGDTCLSAGYPGDKDDGRYMYKSTSTITSLSDCVFTSNNYCHQGQSGSPLFLPGGYAIGITSGHADHTMYSVQLDNGITTWLSQNGYFD